MTHLADRVSGFPIGAAVGRADLEGDPHPTFDRLRRFEPVSWLPALDRWLVTDRRLIVAALRDANSLTVDDPRFSTGRVVGPSMLSLDGARHRRHRRPFVAPFRPGSLGGAEPGSLGSSIDDDAHRLVDRLAPGGRAELRTELAGPLAVAAITRALGLLGAGTTDILTWYRAIVSGVLEVSDGRSIPPATARAVSSLRHRVAETLADDDRRRPSMLRTIATETDLTADELFSNVAVVMFGAIETSEAMTANALFHLLSHPDQLAEVAEDRSLLDNAVEESLRLEPAAAVVDRYATADLQVGPSGGEAAIDGGDLVTLSLSAANRDPDLFDDPHRFDIHRPNATAQLAFVQGPHACIGSHMARLETKAAISAVLDGLPGVTLDCAATSPPSGLIFRKPERLTARWR